MASHMRYREKKGRETGSGLRGVPSEGMELRCTGSCLSSSLQCIGSCLSSSLRCTGSCLSSSLVSPQVFTHEMMLRDLGILNFRPMVRGPQRDSPLWETLFAAASGGSPPTFWGGAPAAQLSSATLRLYTTNQETLASLSGVYLQQQQQQQQQQQEGGAAASTSSDSADVLNEEHHDRATLTARTREGDSLLDLLRKGGVRDPRRILLPFFFLGPLSWDGRGIDLAYLCLQRALSCFAASSKWWESDPFLSVSLSLMMSSCV